MSAAGVYLFQGNSFIVPESVKDEELSGGVDPDAANRGFGGLEYVSVPPLGSGPPITGFLLKDDAPLPPLWRSIPVRQVMSVLTAAGTLPGSPCCRAGGPDLPDLDLIERFLRIYHVLQWRNDSVYCGSCGEKNGDSPSELARLCGRCGRIEYPRISPAVITLVTDDSGRALLAHNKKFKDRMYSLIAGFVEAGESLEAAASREIKEELAIDVKDIRYARSQSWPFPNSLMIGFTARYAGGTFKPDGEEIVDARWFTRESIRQSIEKTANAAGENPLEVEIPPPGSVSRYIINQWLEMTPQG